MSLPGAIEARPWPTDPRFLARADGVVIGPRGGAVGSVSPDGYVIVSYRTPDGRKSIGAHVIVCEAFHGPSPHEELEVAHDNGDRSDNRPGNLRWDTPKGNQRDKVEHQTNGRKLANEDVVAIRAAAGTPRAELAARYGVTPGMISHIRTGRSWSNLPAAG